VDGTNVEAVVSPAQRPRDELHLGGTERVAHHLSVTDGG
jgi:hypothetical protein